MAESGNASACRAEDYGFKSHPELYRGYMSTKNLELFVFKAIVYLTIIFSAPYLLGMRLDTYLNLPKVFGYPVNIIGLLLILVGLSIDIYSIRTFVSAGKGSPFPWKPPKRLVASGPYKYVRNPIYVAYFIIISGLAIFTNIPSIFIIAILFMLGIHIGVVLWEEKRLEKRFGRAYLNYKKEVPRWIPKTR